MSREARVVAPGDSLQRAAQLMGELDVGALPVCDGERLVGMVTDRDITVRGLAAGKAPQAAHVDEVMSLDVRWCFEDQPVDEVMTQMADGQVRRIAVISHDEARRLVGMVSLGDIATRTRGGPRADIEPVLEEVSRPAAPGAPPPPAAGKTASGVPAALTGLDERGGETSKASVPAGTGQQRVDPSGEPLHSAGGVTPQQASPMGKDNPDKPPSSPEQNAIGSVPRR
jgi:CBS domain-containing protein